MDNSHETVCDNSYTDLYAYSILSCSPKFLYLKMLLEPFEEQLHQPSFLIEISNVQRRKVLRMRQESKRTLIFLVIVSNEPERLGILLFGEISSQFDFSIR